jgi:hypothetical protein
MKHGGLFLYEKREKKGRKKEETHIVGEKNNKIIIKIKPIH